MVDYAGMALIIPKGIYRHVLCLVILVQLRDDQTNVRSTTLTSGKVLRRYDDKQTVGLPIFGGFFFSHLAASRTTSNLHSQVDILGSSQGSEYGTTIVLILILHGSHTPNTAQLKSILRHTYCGWAGPHCVSNKEWQGILSLLLH